MDKALICCICGLEILAKERKNREHEPPLSRGGEPKNWQWAHAICNCIKANMTMEEFVRVAPDRYAAALRWQIKNRDKQTVRRVLNKLNQKGR